MEMSSRAPRPVVVLPASAAHTPKAALMPAARSATGRGGIVAWPPSGTSAPDHAW